MDSTLKSAVIAAVAAILGAALVPLLQRAFAKKDSAHQEAATVKVAEINASTEFTSSLIERVHTLEKNTGELHGELLSATRRIGEVEKLEAQCQINLGLLKKEVAELMIKLDSITRMRK